MNSTLHIVTDARPAGTPAVRSGTLLDLLRQIQEVADKIPCTCHVAFKNMSGGGSQESMRDWQPYTHTKLLKDVGPFDVMPYDTFKCKRCELLDLLKRSNEKVQI